MDHVQLRKPFALKVMLSVLPLFTLHDFLLSSIMWWSSFAFVCKHHNIYLYLPLKVIHIYTEFPAPEALHRKTAYGGRFCSILNWPDYQQLPPSGKHSMKI